MESVKILVARLCVATLLTGVVAVPALAADLPRVDPAAVGLSADRLERLDAAIQSRIDAGDFPGAVVMVARDGKVAHLGAFGARTPGGEDMTEDSIFRIFSMTKPIVSVAAMMLVEEGKLDLSTPIHNYLPEFKEMTVATGKADDGSIESEPVNRPITVHDLLRHTAGMTYGFFGTGPAREAMNARDLGKGDFTNREHAQIVASLPLEHQPGSAWEYSRATDVLGALIEVVDGRTLSESLKARIFDPLGMDSTGFTVADASQHSRIAEPNEDDRNIGHIPIFDPKEPQMFESGGGGLVSTVHDYSRFLQMLLNGGELDGARILSPHTVANMTSDHLGSIGPGKYYLPGAGYGFGLGFGVRKETGVSPATGSKGEFSWGGAAGTYFVGDPENDMFFIYMMQAPSKRLEMRSLMRNMVYGSLEQ